MAIVDWSCMIFYWETFGWTFLGLMSNQATFFGHGKNQALGDFPDGLPFSHPFMAPWLWSPSFLCGGEPNSWWVSITTFIWVFPKNRGFPPKSSILIGFSSINHPFWGIHIFWKHPYLDFADLFWSCRFSFWWIVRDFLCVDTWFPVSTFLLHQPGLHWQCAHRRDLYHFFPFVKRFTLVNICFLLIGAPIPYAWKNMLQEVSYHSVLLHFLLYFDIGMQRVSWRRS